MGTSDDQTTKGQQAYAFVADVLGRLKGSYSTDTAEGMAIYLDVTLTALLKLQHGDLRALARFAPSLSATNLRTWRKSTDFFQR